MSARRGQCQVASRAGKEGTMSLTWRRVWSRNTVIRLGLWRTCAGGAGQGRKAVTSPSRQHSEYYHMKVLSIPSSDKIGQVVSYKSRFGNCQRRYCLPANPRSPAQKHMRRGFGSFAPAWSRVLTQAQREAWNVAGPKVQSKTRLSSGPLTGQQLFQGLNSARFRIAAKMLLTPPVPVIFEPSVVGRLTLTNGEGGVRLLLSVTGPVTEDIMVFGQAPCSAGRMKRSTRLNSSHLG